MKRSKLQRKYVNQMRGMGDVPWPARRFKYPATLAAASVGTCPKPIELEWRRRGRGLLGYVRAPEPVTKPCGGRLVLIPYARRVECIECRLDRVLTRRRERVANPPATAEVYVRWHARKARAAVGRIFKQKAGP